jgi:hypothetical protein
MTQQKKDKKEIIEEENEEPMELGSIFGIRIILIVVVLITIIVGVPYLIMK